MSILQIGGYQWDADKVGWGGYGPSKWEMLGYVGRESKRGRVPPGEKRDFTVNVWEVQAVYTLYRGERLIYAGEGTLGDRLLKHHKDDWLCGKWDTFSWLSPWGINASNRPYSMSRWDSNKAITLDCKHLIQLIECVLINLAEPSHNKKSPAMTDHIRWLPQHRSQHSRRSVDEKIDQILEHLDAAKK